MTRPIVRFRTECDSALALHREQGMKLQTNFLLLVATAIALSGCAANSNTSADITAGLRASLDQSGYKDVKTSQDRAKGIVTLTGHVPADADKLQAETIARQIAGTQVVANEIAVVVPGAEAASKAMNENLDKGIESNLKAALISEGLAETVKFEVKNHVVTLAGTVVSQAKREWTEKVAAGVPNVQQVVNTLQVKNQKATSN